MMINDHGGDIKAELYGCVLDPTTSPQSGRSYKFKGWVKLAFGVKRIKCTTAWTVGMLLCVCGCSPWAATPTTTDFWMVTLVGHLTLALYRFHPGDSGAVSCHRLWSYLVYSVVQWGWQIAKKRWRKAVKWAPYPLLSCLLAFPSSSPLLLPKGRRRSKEADMKGMPEIVFLDALSLFSLPHRYGNVESQIQLAPMMHIVCLSLIFLFFSSTLCLLSSPSS